MSAVTLHAITVLGGDRPGIIAETTAILAGLGLNLEDSSMTLLRGRGVAAVAAALAPLEADGRLTVSVREVSAGEPAPIAGSSWVLTVHGGDRPGIVSSIVARVAAVGGNITDLTTRLAGELYLLVAEVDLPHGVDPEEVRTALRAAADELGVDITLHEVEADEL